jgi:hypothetical protein
VLHWTTRYDMVSSLEVGERELEIG